MLIGDGQGNPIGEICGWCGGYHSSDNCGHHRIMPKTIEQLNAGNDPTVPSDEELLRKAGDAN